MFSVFFVAIQIGHRERKEHKEKGLLEASLCSLCSLWLSPVNGALEVLNHGSHGWHGWVGEDVGHRERKEHKEFGSLDRSL